MERWAQLEAIPRTSTFLLWEVRTWRAGLTLICDWKAQLAVHTQNKDARYATWFDGGWHVREDGRCLESAYGISRMECEFKPSTTSYMFQVAHFLRAELKIIEHQRYDGVLELYQDFVEKADISSRWSAEDCNVIHTYDCLVPSQCRKNFVRCVLRDARDNAYPNVHAHKTIKSVLWSIRCLVVIYSLYSYFPLSGIGAKSLKWLWLRRWSCFAV